MVKTKAPTPPPTEKPASQADEPYFEGQAAIAPEDVPSPPTAQQLSADDGGASAIPPAASDEASASPPDAEAAPLPPSSSVETTPPSAPSADQLLSAKRVKACAKDPQSGGFYVGGELITAEPREVDLRNIRRRSRAHLDKFLSDERIAFEIVSS